MEWERRVLIFRLMVTAPWELEGDAFDDAAVDPTPAPVVELGGGRVRVADQLLDLFDGDVLAQQGGHDHDAEGMRRQAGGQLGGLEPPFEHGPDGGGPLNGLAGEVSAAFSRVEP